MGAWPEKNGMGAWRQELGMGVWNGSMGMGEQEWEQLLFWQLFSDNIFENIYEHGDGSMRTVRGWECRLRHFLLIKSFVYQFKKHDSMRANFLFK